MHLPTNKTDPGVRLPAPGPEAVKHSAKVTEFIREEIEAAGDWIRFSRFMDLCLYAPGLGYYSAGSMNLGRSGDFITAPELSNLFSKCVASQCAEVLDHLGQGEILEIGAGSGVMAAEILIELERQNCLPLHYLILEVSADLRQRQRDTVSTRAPHLISRVAWLDKLPEKPLTGIVLANEVLDALPVERFRARDGHVELMGVGWNGEQFEARYAEAPDAVISHLSEIQDQLGASFPDKYQSEVCLGLKPWVTSLAGGLERGVMIFCDYGLPRREYYHPDRSSGTLLCHYRHRAHGNPFTLIGLQDITAWVDFTAVADAAIDAGLSLAGFTPQVHFLIATGLDRHMARTPVTEDESSDLHEQVELARQVKLLTLPGEMGERFKFIGFRRQFDATLSGFSQRDLTGTL